MRPMAYIGEAEDYLMALVDDYKIARFEQVNVMGPRVGRNAAAIAGACHNFSLHWLSMILSDTGGDAGNRMAELARQSGGANPVLQNMFGERWKLEGMAGSDDMILQIHGLVAQDEFNYGAYSAGALTGALSRNTGKGGIYSFWFAGGRVGAEGGAHSVAFYTNQMNDKTVYHFFDPNFGEFLMASGEFNSFWTELTAMYGPLQSHMLRAVKATKKLVLAGR